MTTWTWEGYVKAVAQYPFEYSWKKYLCIAQAIIESGRGTTPLATGHANWNGMKFRKSLEKYGGKSFEYFTDSEPRKPDGSQGSDFFFEFDSYEDSIRTWDHRFEFNENGWVPYPKVVAKDPEVMKDAQSFIEYVGPIYCPYWNVAAHGGLSYAQYIMQKCFPEAKALIDAVPVAPVTDKVSWFEFNRYDNGTPSCMGYAGDRPVDEYKEKSVEGLIAFFMKHSEAKSYLVADTDKVIPSIETQPDPGPDPLPPTGKRVRLDSGHSLKSPGARSNSGKVREEILNEEAIKVIQQHLQQKGIDAPWFNPDPDNLTQVGQSGWGNFDIMVSWHHNSYSGAGNPYVCVMVDPAAPMATKLFAQKCARAIVEALKGTPEETKIFSGTNGMEGVYEAELSVTNTSAKDPDGKPPKHVLVEAYFLNKFNDEAQCISATKKAALAVAKVVVQELSA